MDLYSGFCAHVLFPLQERLKGHSSVAVRRRLEQTQWWDPQKLRQLQNERLQELIRRAVAHVPYYRDLFASLGSGPADVRSAEDLARIPFLTKAIIRANTQALKADDAGVLARSNTGGSSGEPLIFYLGKERVSHDVAAKWRATRWWDVDIGDREIVLWGSPIELGTQDRVRDLRDRLFRTRLLPAFQLSEARLDDFVADIRRTRPAMLFGYPSALARIAHHAVVRRQRMDNLGIKVAFVTSERLYEDQRRAIAETFGCRVANGYGGRDAGFVAHECPAGGMHVTAEDLILEAVDDAGQVLPAGTAGELVVTHLASGDFPFIRYRTGDVGILDDRHCACGRGLPLLREIQGRTTDFVVARDGTVMHGLALIYAVRDVPGVRKFKIVQESLVHTRVTLVVDPGFDELAVERMRRDMVRRLGEGVRVDFERAEDIAPEASGKFRYVVSKVVTDAAGHQDHAPAAGVR